MHGVSVDRLGELYRYCLPDCRMSLATWKELALSKMAVATSWLYESPLNFMASGSTGKAAETLVIGELGRRGLTVTGGQCLPGMDVRGGHVGPVRKGLHRELYAVDVGSLYPLIMLHGMAGSRACFLSVSWSSLPSVASGHRLTC